MFKFLSFFVVSTLLVTLQIGVFPLFHYNFLFIFNLPLLVLVMAVFFLNTENSFLLALLLGLLFDLYSSTFFGFFICVMVLAMALIKIIYSYFLQNKKLAVLLLANFTAITFWYLAQAANLLLFDFVSPAFSSLPIKIIFMYFIIQLSLHSLVILFTYRPLLNIKSRLSGSLLF